MKRALLKLCLVAIALACASASARTPQQERDSILSALAAAYPEKKFDEYAFGALMFRADALAQFDNIMEFPPFIGVIERGKKMWETPFANGKRFADCFPNGGREVLGDYPYFDTNTKRVVTFEMALNQCLRDNAAAPIEHDDMQTMGVLTSYARSLSDGMRINVKVEGEAAEEKFLAGKRIYDTRRGQMNLACVHCHVHLAGRIMRDEIISAVVGQATYFPVFRRGGEELLTTQAYFRRCFTQLRALPPALGSEEMNNLEYYHSYLSNGLPLRASVYRK